MKSSNVSYLILFTLMYIAVCFDELGTVSDAAYFNKLLAFDGAIKHSGDSLDGAGEV